MISALPVLYTSYFANIQKLPVGYTPVSICLYTPSWYNGISCTSLAPTASILANYKQNSDEEQYIRDFNSQVLEGLNCEAVLKNLFISIGNFKGFSYLPSPVLVCFEKPTSFCHRHLVAQWMNEKGFECKEWTKS